jgi:hypothetical protein
METKQTHTGYEWQADALREWHQGVPLKQIAKKHGITFPRLKQYVKRTLAYGHS